MPENDSTIASPQFATAEYSSPQPANSCKVCSQAITASFYRANGSMVCGRCADRIRRETPQDSHAAFVRSFLFGLGGFAIGLVLYAGFVIATGISIGYISLVVGWLVGKAMMMGSGGVGGRRYQITAVLLTYAAVSMAFVPIAISVMRSKPHVPQVRIQPQQQTQATEAEPVSPTADAPAIAPSPAPAARKPAMGLGRAIATLAVIGLGSPFIELQSGGSGVIGLIILLVGMQFAWKITAARSNIKVEGPFKQAASAPA
ncbi:MAG TPA: hypothetical protein VJN64_00555 [Terriglobales bacterium]|nr:hypothetical protein [Terriglobales bacterium]